MDLGASSLSHGPVSGDHLDTKSPLLHAQFGKTWVTADGAALRVSDVFRGPGVALPVHLRDCSTELGLLRSAQHDVLDVTVDEVVIIILLKDLGSRMTKDPIPLLVGECAWKAKGISHTRRVGRRRPIHCVTRCRGTELWSTREDGNWRKGTTRRSNDGWRVDRRETADAAKRFCLELRD